MGGSPAGADRPGAWRRWVRRLKSDTYALYLACRDHRTPWYARLLAGVVVAYALSPIDLVPDFIPVVGQLDDLVIVPLGLLLAFRLIPADVMAECRQRAEVQLADQPTSRVAAAGIVAVWLVTTALLGWLLVSRFG